MEMFQISMLNTTAKATQTTAITSALQKKDIKKQTELDFHSSLRESLS